MDLCVSLSHFLAGKLTVLPCFRVGCIGRLFERDMHALLDAVRSVLREMSVCVPVTQIEK